MPPTEADPLYHHRSIPDAAADIRPASALQQPGNTDTLAETLQPPEEKHNATEMAQGMLLVRLTSLIDGIPADQQAAFETDVINTYDKFLTMQLLNGQTTDQAHNSTQKEILYAMHSHLYQAQFTNPADSKPLPRAQFDTAYQEGIDMAEEGFDVWDPDFNFETTSGVAHNAPISPEEAEDLVQWRMMYDLTRDIYKARSNHDISPFDFQMEMQKHKRAISAGIDPLTINWIFEKKAEPAITIDISKALDTGPVPFSQYGTFTPAPRQPRS